MQADEPTIIGGTGIVKNRTLECPPSLSGIIDIPASGLSVRQGPCAFSHLSIQASNGHQIMSIGANAERTFSFDGYVFDMVLSLQLPFLRMAYSARRGDRVVTELLNKCVVKITSHDGASYWPM